jgi:hypothetical protein
MRDILKNIPKKNCKVCGIMLLVCAGLITGAGYFHIKSAQIALAAFFFFDAILVGGFGALLLKKSKQA